jgi:hypothetical protein
VEEKEAEMGDLWGFLPQKGEGALKFYEPHF